MKLALIKACRKFPINCTLYFQWDFRWPITPWQLLQGRLNHRETVSGRRQFLRTDSPTVRRFFPLLAGNTNTGKTTRIDWLGGKNPKQTKQGESTSHAMRTRPWVTAPIVVGLHPPPSSDDKRLLEPLLARLVHSFEHPPCPSLSSPGPRIHT